MKEGTPHPPDYTDYNMPSVYYDSVRCGRRSSCGGGGWITPLSVYKEGS